jgi:hypothetical protein
MIGPGPMRTAFWIRNRSTDCATTLCTDASVSAGRVLSRRTNAMFEGVDVAGLDRTIAQVALPKGRCLPKPLSYPNA